MIGIYKITNPKGKIYIGQSKNIEKRKFFYKNKRKQLKQQPKIYYSILKYGWEQHKFEIIEECKIEKLDEREIYWISKLKTYKNGLNLTLGGDGLKLNKESEEKRRINSMKPILQYDLEGNFIKEFSGASDAIKILKKGNSNNINDCARGKYKSTYGFMWIYKNEDNFNLKISPYISNKGNFNKWTEEQRLKCSNSRKGEKRSKEYSEKIKLLKQKKVYQYDTNNNLINIFPSFGSFDGSKIIGTKKLRQIINKNIFYKGYKYTYNKIND